jgi:hypothetical protein
VGADDDEVGVLGSGEDDGGRVTVPDVVVHGATGGELVGVAAQVGGRGLDEVAAGGELLVPAGCVGGQVGERDIGGDGVDDAQVGIVAAGLFEAGAQDYVVVVRSGPVRSGPVRSGPVRPDHDERGVWCCWLGHRDSPPSSTLPVSRASGQRRKPCMPALTVLSWCQGAVSAF